MPAQLPNSPYATDLTFNMTPKFLLTQNTDQRIIDRSLALRQFLVSYYEISDLFHSKKLRIDVVPPLPTVRNCLLAQNLANKSLSASAHTHSKFILP